MKRIIVASLLALTATAPASAGWLKDEKPCGARCPTARIATSPSSPFIHQSFGDANSGELIYESRSRSVYSSSYGTSVINGTYRVYRQTEN